MCVWIFVFPITNIVLINCWSFHHVSTLFQALRALTAIGGGLTNLNVVQRMNSNSIQIEKSLGFVKWMTLMFWNKLYPVLRASSSLNMFVHYTSPPVHGRNGWRYEGCQLTKDHQESTSPDYGQTWNLSEGNYTSNQLFQQHWLLSAVHNATLPQIFLPGFRFGTFRTGLDTLRSTRSPETTFCEFDYMYAEARWRTCRDAECEQTARYYSLISAKVGKA